MRGIRVRLVVWSVLALGFALGVGALPLFGVLGFELALATSAFAAICGLDLGAALARADQRRPITLERAGFVGRATLAGTLRAVGLALAFALVPGIVAAIRGIWVQTCDWSFGLATYAALPLATAALAGALGHALGVLVGPRRFAGAIVAQLPIVVLAAAGLARFYSAPPVFSYDAIIGYFPGNLYDENVQLSRVLAWARLDQLCGVIAIVALIATRLDVPSGRFRWRAPRPAGRRAGAWATSAVAGAAAIALYCMGGTLGFAIDADDIVDGALPGTIETPHFVIHYAKTPQIEAQIALIAADHEFRYAQVVAQLGAAPEGKLTSYYFADRDQKGAWMGARDVEMAKPWRKEIYVDHRPFPHPSLRHEIAHAVASAFGDPLFGVSARRVAGVPVLVNPGLVEGLAVAIDWPGGYDHPTPHESVRAMQATGMAVGIRDLLSLQFLSVSSARGYTTAGSFVRFLLDTYGAPALRTLYGSGGDFERAYAKPLETLEAEWLAMIAKIEVPKEIVEGSKERFRGGSVFSRPCPHANAARRERAAELYGAGKRASAVSLLREVCGDAPEEPRYRLELGDYLVSGNEGERAEATKLWEALAADDNTVTASVRADALERLARVAAFHGEAPDALIARAAALPVDGNQRRQLLAETYALQHTGPAGQWLRSYFFGSLPGFDPPAWAKLAIAAEPELGLPHYLAGLQHAIHDDEQAACAEELDRGLTLGMPDPMFVENGARRLAVCAYRAKDTARVQKAIAWLAAQPSEPDRLLSKDWAQRLAFDGGVG